MLDATSRTALVFLSSLSIAGCALAGVRAETGTCPVGETCSSETPTGLFFLGAAFSDDPFSAGGIAPVAAGGTESVKALTGQDDTSPPFAGSFVATSDDPATLTVESVSPPSFVVDGRSAGTTFVKLLEPGTDALLDEAGVEVEAIQSVSLVPEEVILFEAESPHDATPPWALLAGGVAAPIVVRLLGQGTDRLVDQGMALTPASGTAEQKAWDMFVVTPPASTGQASFSVRAGQASFPASVQVVAGVDDVIQADLFSSGVVPVNQSAPFCFVAKSGGVPVAGASWTFTPSSNLAVAPSNTLPLPGCVTLQGNAKGSAKLTVSASGFTRTFDLTISNTEARSAPRHPLARPARRAGAGDRAAAARGL